MKSIACLFPRRLLVVVFAILAISGTALSQLPTATILGVVKDSSGAVIAGASLTVRNVDTSETRTTVSGSDGSYRFSALPVGNYELRAEHAGFQTEVQSGITLTVSQEAVMNVLLQVGSVNQTVSVTTEAPIVNVTNASLGGLVSEQKIADLPLNGRNYIDLTLLQPGISKNVNVAPVTGLAGTWFSSNGAPMRANNYLLDGTELMNWDGGNSSSVAGNTLGVDGIQEYRVLTGSYGAEYGMSMGAQTVMVSKSGTNTLHGTAFEYIRNSAVDAANYFYAPGVANGEARIPAFRRNNFGGSLGAPLKKDKTFIFGTYEGLRQSTGVTQITNTLAAGCHGAAGATITVAACPQLAAGTNAPSVVINPVIAPLLAIFPVPNLANNQVTFPQSLPVVEDYGGIRVDHVFSQKDRMFGRYTIQNSNTLLQEAYPLAVNPGTSRMQFITLAEDHIFSPSLLNSIRLSYDRSSVDYNVNCLTSIPAGFNASQYSFVPGLGLGGVTFQTQVTSYCSPTIFSQRLQMGGLGDDVFYTHGRHSLKFGILFNRPEVDANNESGLIGSVSFSNVANFLQGIPVNYSREASSSNTIRHYVWYSFEEYIQDDIRVSNRFTLNLGLRYEPSTQVTEINGIQAALRGIGLPTIGEQIPATTTIGPEFLNPTMKNFSPRLGFAWDVFGDGKTAVRGGAAILKDTLANLGSAYTGSASSTTPFSANDLVAFPRPVGAPCQTLTVPFCVPNTLATVSLRVFQWHMGQPRIATYSLTVERHLPFDIAATLSYAGSHGSNLIQSGDGNPNVPFILPNGQPCWFVAGTTCPLTSNTRIQPALGSVQLYSGTGYSNYNSLQFGLLKRLGHGLQFQSSYTWSKVMDDRQDVTSGEGETGSAPDPFNPRLEYGPAPFDDTNVFRFNAIYNIPKIGSGEGILNKLVNGWWMSTIVSINSGLPINVSLGSNRSGSGVNSGASAIDRPNLAPGRNAYNITHGVSVDSNGPGNCPANVVGQKLGTPQLLFDPCAFTFPAAGFLGDVGRDFLRAPTFSNTDFSLVKDTPIGFREGLKLQFRVEVFNLFNHPNFGVPFTTNSVPLGGIVYGSTGAIAPTAGVSTSTISVARQIQFALKLLF